MAVFDRRWLECAGIRAVKTFAQVAVSMLTVGQAVLDVNWLNVLSVSAVAAVVSILTSVAGLPEATSEVTKDFRNDDDRDGV